MNTNNLEIWNPSDEEVANTSIKDKWGFFENWSDGLGEDIEVAKKYFPHSIDNLKDSWSGFASKFAFDNPVYKLNNETKSFIGSMGVDMEDIENLEKNKNVLSENEWKQSEHFRDGLEFNPFWTNDIAKKKAEHYDKKKEFEKIANSGSKLSAAFGVVVSAPELLTPGNLATLPILGGASGGLIKASSKLVNSVTNNAIAMGLGSGIDAYFISEDTGEKMNAEDYANHMLNGAIIGAVFGGGLYGVGKGVELYKKHKGNLTSENIVNTTKELYNKYKSSNKKDLSIEAERTQNNIDILNGNKKQQKPMQLKSNEYIDLDTLEINNLPTTRINLGVNESDPLRNIEGQWKVLEADLSADNGKPKISPSHILVDGIITPNKNYLGVQPKEIDKDSVANIFARASNLDLRLLLKDNVTIDRGAAVVDKQGNVISANHRTLQQMINYANGDPVGFKQSLSKMGINIDGFNNPVLVFEMAKDFGLKDITRIAQGANKATTGSYSNVEKAVMESIELGDSFQYLSNNLHNLSENKNFIQSFLKNKTSEEARELISNNKLTKLAMERIERAVVMHAYDNPRMIKAIYTNIDNEVFNSLQKSLIETAPAFARMRTKIENGLLDPNSDITNNLSNAFDKLLFIKDMNANDRVLHFQTKDMISQIDPLSETLTRMFFKNEHTMDGIISGKQANEMLEKIASFLEDSGTKDMFKSEYDLTNGKILDKIDKIKSDIKGNNNVIMHKDMPSTSFQEMEKAINETPVEIENRDMMSLEDIEKTTNELNTTIESIDKDSNVITENKKSLDGFKKTKQALDDYILCMYGE